MMKYFAFIVLLGAALVHCHSWVDNVTVVGGVGPLTQDFGYIRAYGMPSPVIPLLLVKYTNW